MQKNKQSFSDILRIWRTRFSPHFKIFYHFALGQRFIDSVLKYDPTHRRKKKLKKYFSHFKQSPESDSE